MRTEHFERIRFIMKKYTAPVAAFGVAAAILVAPVSAYADNVNNNTAFAGVRFAIEDINKASVSGKSDNTTTETSVGMAGIATAFGKYYVSGDVVKDTATVSGIEKILKLASEETEETEATTQETQEPQTSVVEGYTNLGVANVTNYLNVRETPSTDASLLGKLPMNAGCEILETLDGWYKISSGDVMGYVSAEFLLTGDAANERAKEALATVATVNADKLMVREQPSTESAILNRVAQNEDLEVAAVLDGWVQVNITGTTGYVSADYVTVHNTLPKGVTLEELNAQVEEASESAGISVVEYAKQFLGNPYVWGGTSLTNGCDCSGFTMRIYEHFGYSLSRTSAAQSGNGTRVSLSEIQPGDLLFYSYGGSIGHVAMYIGGGQIIHASTERTGICIGNAYFMTPTCAVRIAG